VDAGGDVITNDLDAAFAEMAQEESREAEATAGDVADEAG
jgi:hypothetical protein